MTILLALIALAGDWAQLDRDSLNLLKSGRFADAERIAKHALSTAGDDYQRAVSHMTLGRIYRDWEHCERAIRSVERGVQLFGKTGDQLVTMEAAAQLVSIFLECGAAERARAVHKRYVDLPLARRSLPPHRVSQLVGNAGVIELQRRRLDAAAVLLLEALALAKPSDQPVLHGLLAQLFLDKKDPARARYHTDQSLAKAELIGILDHPLAVKTLANLSILYARLGDHPRSDHFHEKALQLAYRYYEPESPLIADMLTNRAHALRSRDRKDEARALEAQARAMRSVLPRTGVTGSLSVLERR